MWHGVDMGRLSLIGIYWLIILCKNGMIYVLVWQTDYVHTQTLFFLPSFSNNSVPPLSTRGPIYYHGLTLIPAWISYHTLSKVWDEITYPFPNFSIATAEVWEWISNLIPHIIMVVNYLSMLEDIIQNSQLPSTSHVHDAAHPPLYEQLWEIIIT